MLSATYQIIFPLSYSCFVDESKLFQVYAVGWPVFLIYFLVILAELHFVGLKLSCWYTGAYAALRPSLTICQLSPGGNPGASDPHATVWGDAKNLCIDPGYTYWMAYYDDELFF